jgi:hypothetical protein
MSCVADLSQPAGQPGVVQLARPPRPWVFVGVRGSFAPLAPFRAADQVVIRVPRAAIMMESSLAGIVLLGPASEYIIDLRQSQERFRLRFFAH